MIMSISMTIIMQILMTTLKLTLIFNVNDDIVGNGNGVGLVIRHIEY